MQRATNYLIRPTQKLLLKPASLAAYNFSDALQPSDGAPKTSSAMPEGFDRKAFEEKFENL